MPHFNLRYFLETLGSERGRDVFIVQVGAMDGKTFDPVHEFITKFDWAGLLVEPMPEHFSALQHTYRDHPRLALAHVAIAEKAGEAVMYRIPAEHVESGAVPKWGTGAASLYSDRNALAFDEVRPFIAEHSVDCMTLPQLFTTHKVERIDVLQIDTEGHDYHVLRQLNFARYAPLVINLEIVNLPAAEQTACKHLLDEHGYIHAKGGYDLLAVSKDFFTK